MDKREQLLPCPFCGGEAERRSGPEEYVLCPNEECNASPSAWGTTVEDATRAWNLRVPSQYRDNAGAAQAAPQPVLYQARRKPVGDEITTWSSCSDGYFHEVRSDPEQHSAVEVRVLYTFTTPPTGTPERAAIEALERLDKGYYLAWKARFERGEPDGYVGGNISTNDVACVIEGFRALASPAPEQPDPMDWPLPCDVRFGHITIKKGVRFGTLLTRLKVADSMYSELMAKEPRVDLSAIASPAPERDGAILSNSTELKGAAQPEPGAVEWDAERLARFFHERYETLAPLHGWQTQRASSVPFDDLPGPNKHLMMHVCREVLSALRKQEGA